jgi:hypothetical protein
VEEIASTWRKPQTCDKFLLQGIEFLRKLTEGQVIDAQKTIPLKDNSGHYGNLFMGDICLNEQVKEQGYAYLRPAMSSNTLYRCCPKFLVYL